MCYNRAVIQAWRLNMKTEHKNNTAKRALAAAAACAMLFTLASCSNEKLYSNPEMTASQTASDDGTSDTDLTYDAVNTRIKEYDEELSLYMLDHLQEATRKEYNGTSYAGVPAYIIYTLSADGQYQALQMEKTYDDRTVVDEYFDLGDAMVFARTTVYNSGDYGPVEKYYITDGIVYKLDSESKTLIAVAEVDSADSADAQAELDMYFTFDEILTLYG